MCDDKCYKNRRTDSLRSGIRQRGYCKSTTIHLDTLAFNGIFYIFALIYNMKNMHELKIETRAQVFSYAELPASLQALVQRAKEQVQNSYSPYSHFAVGAALLLDNGEILTGSNQENAAYPSGLCAERTVLFYAHANRPEIGMRALAIAGYTNGSYVDDPVSPCGSCRQVMAEFEQTSNHPMQVLLCGAREVYLFESARDLLPYSFLKESLLSER